MEQAKKKAKVERKEKEEQGKRDAERARRQKEEREQEKREEKDRQRREAAMTDPVVACQEAAKKAKMWLMKWRSLSESLTQSAISEPRSISSAVQKEASAFLYISQSCGGRIQYKT